MSPYILVPKTQNHSPDSGKYNNFQHMNHTNTSKFEHVLNFFFFVLSTPRRVVSSNLITSTHSEKLFRFIHEPSKCYSYSVFSLHKAFFLKSQRSKEETKYVFQLLSALNKN